MSDNLRSRIVPLIFQMCHQLFFASKHFADGHTIKMLALPVANKPKIKANFSLMNARIEPFLMDCHMNTPLEGQKNS